MGLRDFKQGFVNIFTGSETRIKNPTLILDQKVIKIDFIVFFVKILLTALKILFRIINELLTGLDYTVKQL